MTRYKIQYSAENGSVIGKIDSNKENVGFFLVHPQSRKNVVLDVELRMIWREIGNVLIIDIMIPISVQKKNKISK